MNEIEKQKIIFRALVLYWDCEVCKQLDWKKDCEKNKDSCCYNIYEHLRGHIHAIDKIKAGKK